MFPSDYYLQNVNISSLLTITCINSMPHSQETISISRISKLSIKLFLILGGVHVWEQTIARSGRLHRQQCGVLDISLISANSSWGYLRIVMVAPN